MSYQPTLHHPVPMGARVKVPAIYDTPPQEGTVVGVASMYISFTYIILLDNPVVDPDFGEIKAITKQGQDLEGVDGTSWKILPKKYNPPEYDFKGNLIEYPVTAPNSWKSHITPETC